MPELVDAEALAMVEESRSAALAWRALVGWVGIVLQIVVQVFRFSPSSWSQILSFIGFRDHPFLSSSTFKPLPSDTPAFAPAASSATAVEALEKLTIVLDLDETLVCAYEAYSLPDMVRNQAIEAGLKSFDLECLSMEKEVEGRGKVNHVVVFERPGLEEFLHQISKFADLVLFTAGLEGYAKPLVDIIDSNNKFSLRLYRPATVTTI